MLKSIISASLRRGIVPTRHTATTTRVFAFPSTHKYFSRSYCKDHTPPHSSSKVDPKNVIKNVPHKAFDADVDFQVDSKAVELPISLERRKYIEFDCIVCDTRVKKTCSAHSYEKGNPTISSSSHIYSSFRCCVDKVFRL